MITVYSVSALILAYLCGSIPTAVWIGLAFYDIDVREYGSGNAGATNTFRVLGKKAGIPVMLLDILKGWTATNLAYFIGVSTTGPSNSIAYTNYALALGIAAVMGHLFPIFPTSIRSVVIYGMCICLLILVTHQKNIERLLKGTESKVNFLKKKTT